MAEKRISDPRKEVPRFRTPPTPPSGPTQQTTAGLTGRTVSGGPKHGAEGNHPPPGAKASRPRERIECDLLEGRPYWHGPLPKDVAEHCLEKLDNGHFLLRYNDQDERRGFIVALRWEGQNRNIKLIFCASTNAFTLDSQNWAQSVRELIDSHWLRAIPAFQVKMILKHPVPRSLWELDPSKIVKNRKIGEGAFGEVWHCKYVRKGSERSQHAESPPREQKGASEPAAAASADSPAELDVAVKYCKDQSASGRKDFEREAMFQLKFHNPNIVATIGVVTTGPNMMIVLEYMAKGNLRDYLKKNKEHISNAKLKTFCINACSGLAYLERKHVIHRDVAARNLLINDKEIVKIGDFGLAKASDCYKMLEGRVSVKWMAPESMMSGEFTCKSDVWAFGIMMWEIYSWGAEPYPGIETKELRRRVTKENFHPEPPSSVPASVGSAMLACWARRAKDRPTFADLLRVLRGPQATLHSPSKPTLHRAPSNVS